MNYRYFKFLISFSLALMLYASAGHAEVYINGYLVRQLNVLHELAGEPVPSASYWLMNNGNWGYAGNPQIRGNLYAMNAGRYWLAENGNWGYAGSQKIQGNIFLGTTYSQPARKPGKQYRSYHSPDSNGGGSFASDGRCGYISIDGMSIKQCD